MAYKYTPLAGLSGLAGGGGYRGAINTSSRLVASRPVTTSTWQPDFGTIGQAQPEHKAPRSLLGQAWDAATGWPKGIFHFAGEVAKESVAPVRAAVEGDWKYIPAVIPGFGQAVGLGTGLAFGEGNNNDVATRLAHYLPASAGQGQSGHRTLQRVQEGIPGTLWGAFQQSRGNEIAYQKEAREGRLVGALLEDAANASIAFGAAGKLIGTAPAIGVAAEEAAARVAANEAAQQTFKAGAREAATTAGATAEEIASAGARAIDRGAMAQASRALRVQQGTGVTGALARRGLISEATAGSLADIGGGLGTAAEKLGAYADPVFGPVRVIGKGAKLAFPEEVGRLAEAGAQTLRAVAPKFHAMNFTPEGRTLRQLEGERAGRTTELEGQLAQAGNEVTKALKKAGIPEGNRVLNILGSEQLSTYRDAWAKLGPEEFTRRVDNAFSDVAAGQRPTGADAALAMRYLDGALPAAQAEAITQGVQALREISGERTRRELAAGELSPRMVENPADWAQPGVDPDIVAARQAGLGEVRDRRAGELNTAAVRARAAQSKADAAAALAEAVPETGPRGGLRRGVVVAEGAGLEAERLPAAGPRLREQLASTPEGEAIINETGGPGVVRGDPASLQGAVDRAEAQGKAQAAAQAAVGKVNRIQRSVDRITGKIAGTGEALSRSVQERIRIVNGKLLRILGENVTDAEGATYFKPGSLGKRMLAEAGQFGDQPAVLAALRSIDEAMKADPNLELGSTVYVEQALAPLRDSFSAELNNKIDNHITSGLSQRAHLLANNFDDWMKAVPARFRPSLVATKRMMTEFLGEADALMRAGKHAEARMYMELADDMTTTVAGMLDKGIDPVHLVGGDVPETKVGAPARPKVGRGTAPVAQHTTTAKETGLHAIEQEAYINRERQAATSQVRQEFNDAVNTQIARRADDHLAPELSQTDLSQLPEPDRAAALTEMAHQKGLVPVQGDIGAQIAPDTLLVPEAIRHEIDGYWDPETNPLWKGLAKFNSKWKSWILPYSPKWHLGNVVGNAMMAMVYGGISPLELAAAMRDVKRGRTWGELWREGPVGHDLPRSLGGTSLGAEERAAFGKSIEGAEPRTAIGRGQRQVAAGSYKLNQFADEMTRSAVYLAKLKKGIPGEVAIRESLNALGDFTSMTSFERNKIRQVLPFYAWIRHQTQAMMRLPVEHPARAVWLMHLGELASDDEEFSKLWEGYGGPSVPFFGGQRLGLSGTDPFANPGQLPLSPGQAIGSMSPLVNLSTAALLGTNLRAKGGPGQFTRPAAAGEGGGQWQHPAELAYGLLGTTPQSKAIRDYLGFGASTKKGKAIEFTPGKQRNAAGYRTKYKPGQTRLATLLAGLNIPVPSEPREK